jgi:hypothetical protein
MTNVHAWEGDLIRKFGAWELNKMLEHVCDVATDQKRTQTITNLQTSNFFTL